MSVHIQAKIPAVPHVNVKQTYGVSFPMSSILVGPTPRTVTDAREYATSPVTINGPIVPASVVMLMDNRAVDYYGDGKIYHESNPFVARESVLGLVEYSTWSFTTVAGYDGDPAQFDLDECNVFTGAPTPLRLGGVPMMLSFYTSKYDPSEPVSILITDLVSKKTLASAGTYVKRNSTYPEPKTDNLINDYSLGIVTAENILVYSTVPGVLRGVSTRRVF